jgi:ribosomal protein L10
MVSERKIEMVDELTGDLEDAGDVVFADFQGLTVDEFEDLRQDLYEKDSRVRVVKNRLAERAFRRAFSGSSEESTTTDDSGTEGQSDRDLDLTDISGLGPSKVDTLEEEGFETVASLAEADVGDLTDVPGVGEATAEKFVEGARELLEEDGSASTSDSDESTSEESTDESVESLLEDVNEILNGNTALALSFEGYVNVAETMVDFSEEHEDLQIKGGLLDGGFLDPDEVESVSELPSRRELLTSVAGTLNKPLQDLAHHLRYPLHNLVRTLDELKNQKEENES